MNKNAKNRNVAIFPNGDRHIITRSGGLYYWKPGHGSSHMDNLRECVAAEGGKVVREPNPYYRPATPGASKANGIKTLERNLDRFFGLR